MKKLMALLMVLCMMVCMTACGGAGDNDTTAAPGTSTTEAPDGDTTEDGTETETDGSGEQIVLRFASWALGTEEDNNLERQMIAAFEKAHPDIKIEIAEEIVDPWNDALNTAAAGGDLPDVALISTLTTAVANKWALDVTALAAADPEWNNIPASLIESGQYNGKQYGIPTAMHLAGLFINTDYFEEMNVMPLEYGYDWDTFMDAVEKLHKPSEGKVALKYVNDFVNFLPYLWDENQGWYTYDGTEMHLDSDEFIRAVKTTNKLVQYSWAGLSGDQKALTAGKDKSDYDAWFQGYAGIWYDASWCCEGYAKDLSFNTEFVGLADGKSVIIPDYCFIASTTEHPEEAWEFVKFMFWGTEGINTRMDLDAADPEVSWSNLPLNMDEAIVERYFENYPVKGVEEAFRGMNENGTVVEAYKFAPGYDPARWNGKTGIVLDDVELTMANVIDKCILGELSIDDYATQLNTLANNFIKAERDAVDDATK